MKPDPASAAYREKLSRFEQRLLAAGVQASTVPELRDSLESLLSENVDAESDVRAILQRQFDAGNLQREGLGLVLKILDRLSADEPDAAADAEGDIFVETTVIAPDQSSETETDRRLQIGTVLRDRYLLQEEIAVGNVGVVYKAIDRRPVEGQEENRQVAIKVLAPNLARNEIVMRALQQEAAKGRCLSHSNIVRFLDLEREEELYFVVMEWLDGQSLQQILESRQSRGLELETSLDIVRKVGRALEYAHRCGVVHADVKPDNIIITAGGEVKLFDFGVARVRQLERQAQQDGEGQGATNPDSDAYSSLQVIEGEEPAPADDVFSLGCLLYRLLAGHRVFGPRNASAAHKAGMRPSRPQGLSDEHWGTLLSAVAYFRDHRFSSVAEFLDALDRQPGGRLTRTVHALKVQDAGSFMRSWGTLAGVAIVVAVGAFLGRDRIAGLIGADSAAPPQVEGPAISRGDGQAPATGAGAQAQSSVDPRVLSEEELAFSGPILELVAPGRLIPEFDLVLREDDDPVSLMLARIHDVDRLLALRILEASPDGRPLLGMSGQLQFEADGFVDFEPGDGRVTIDISGTPDQRREPDRQLKLVIAEPARNNFVHAVLNVTLEDDDRRTFEAALPPNTVAFAAGEMSVGEYEPAAQIDVQRFKPDDQRLDVAFVVRDVTATEGKDYFAEPTNTVSFGPGQRIARIFIPLVQDTIPENDDTFMLELLVTGSDGDANLHRRINVSIRDDDS